MSGLPRFPTSRRIFPRYLAPFSSWTAPGEFPRVGRDQEPGTVVERDGGGEQERDRGQCGDDDATSR